MKTSPTRTRWAKERRGLISRSYPLHRDQLVIEADADTAPIPTEPEYRRRFILAYLEPFEGQSKAQRAAAVGWLNDQGYGDEEISEALRVETRRLEAIGDLLRNPPGFLSYRERAAKTDEQGTYISDSTRKAAQNGR